MGPPGRREEALGAIEETVTIRRELTEARPGAFRADLAASLNNQSVFLADLGRPERALAAIEETVTIRRERRFGDWLATTTISLEGAQRLAR